MASKATECENFEGKLKCKWTGLTHISFSCWLVTWLDVVGVGISKASFIIQDLEDLQQY